MPDTRYKLSADAPSDDDPAVRHYGVWDEEADDWTTVGGQRACGMHLGQAETVLEFLLHADTGLRPHEIGVDIAEPNPDPSGPAQDTAETPEAEIGRLRAEVARLRAESS